MWETEPPLALPHSSRNFLSLGLQVLLPEYLRERFVAAALSYITCSSEGELICRGHDCWCKCSPTFPECNCPDADIRALEDSLLQIQDSWVTHNQQFEESGEQSAGPRFLPGHGEWLGGADLECGERSMDPRSPTSCLCTPSRLYHHHRSQVVTLLLMQLDMTPTKKMHFVDVISSGEYI